MAPARLTGEAPVRMAHLLPTACGRLIPRPPDGFRVAVFAGTAGALRGDINIFSGLDKAASRQGDALRENRELSHRRTGRKDDRQEHQRFMVSRWTSSPRHVGGQTPLPSLELGIDPVISGIDSNVGLRGCTALSPGVRPPSRSHGRSIPIRLRALRDSAK